MADIEARAMGLEQGSSDEEPYLVAPGPRSAGRGRRAAFLGGASLLLATAAYASQGRGRGARHAFAAGSFVELAAQAEQAGAQVGSALTAGLLPQETHGDDNPCADDEERHMGLCYDKCSILTGGEYPVRSSAWTCCKSNGCVKNPFSFLSCCKHNMGWCSGYDIAGMREGNKVCPHKPGACLTDEELFIGVCYKSCLLLSKGELPYRVGPATCCKRKDATCIIEEGVKDGFKGESRTDPTFNVGGGCDDNEDLTKCEPHAPQLELTE